MTKTVRDYIEVREVASLDALIAELSAIRDRLPADAEPEVRLRGDDYFGRHIAVAYKRPLTAEEADLHARYAGAAPASVRDAA